MVDDIKYTYVVNQDEVVKQAFLNMCKNEVDRFISCNKKYLKDKLSFMILPDKPYEEKITFHNVCKCDDINDIRLNCNAYNSDSYTPIGCYTRRDITFPAYERFGFYTVSCYCDKCRCHISTHKFTPTITYKNSLINKHILSFLQFSQASYEDDITSKTFKN